MPLDGKSFYGSKAWLEFIEHYPAMVTAYPCTWGTEHETRQAIKTQGLMYVGSTGIGEASIITDTTPMTWYAVPNTIYKDASGPLS